MPGKLVGDTVVVEEEREASQIYSKGFFGYPQSGGSLHLDLLEALHLLEGDRIEVFADDKKIDFAELMMRAAALHNDLETRFIVYRDLRQRGYVVKTDSGDFNFRLYPRGGTPTTTQTNLWVLAVSERYIFNIVELMRQAEMSQRTRKELLLAVVDEEGDITYYTAENAEPKGELNDTPMKEVPEGLLMEGSILVLDEPHGTKLYQYGFYGKKIGKMLQLSFIETAYLIEHGRLSLRAVGTGRKMAERTFLKRAKEIQPDFDMRLLAYSDLRSRKLVVKTGFKYGTHFRVYKGDPSSHHSEYLVHAVPDDYSTVWAEISRAIRLAHGVKKDILFARVSKDAIGYMKLKRVKP
jgi:tRNA-intron endonuclease